MKEQPEALRLADDLEQDYCSCHEGFKGRGLIDPQCESCQTKDWRNEAAAELRRLHAEVERLTLDGMHTCHAECQRPVCRLTRERDALLKIVRIVDAHYSGSLDYRPSYVRLARAAIAAAEGEK